MKKKRVCRQKGIPLIKNNNLNSKRNLSRRKLHLNDAGCKNFKQILTSFE